MHLLQKVYICSFHSSLQDAVKRWASVQGKLLDQESFWGEEVNEVLYSLSSQKIGSLKKRFE